jgi:hypothetical protein
LRRSAGVGSFTNPTFFLAACADNSFSSAFRSYGVDARQSGHSTIYLHGYQETIKLGKAAFADADAPVPQDVPDELVQAILPSRRQRP